MTSPYTIKQGDTLSGIAKANNTTVENLQSYNPNITDVNKIQAGATLNLSPIKNAQTSNYPVNSTISASDLSNTKSLVVPPLVSDNTASNNLNTTNSIQSSQATADIKTNTSTSNQTPTSDTKTVKDKLLSLIGMQGDKTQFTSDLQNQQDIVGKTQALNKVNNDILLTTQAYDNQIKELRKNDVGAVGGGVSSAITELTRKKNEDLANLNIIKAVSLNDLNTANDIIDKKVTAKFEPIDNQIKSYQNLYTLLQNDLSESEKAIVESNLANSKLQKNMQVDMYKGAFDALAKGGATESAFKQAEDAFNKGDITKMWAIVAPYAKKVVTSGNNIISDNERALLGQFNSLPIVKDYNNIVAQKITVDNIIKNGTGGPADLALVYTFMKGLDPNSVVRETEYANAAKSGNIFAGAFAKFNGYFKENGGFLPESVQSEFKNIVNQRLISQQQQYDNLAKGYRDIAIRQGLNPDNVVINYGGALNLGETNNPTKEVNTSTKKQDPNEYRKKYGY